MDVFSYIAVGVVMAIVVVYIVFLGWSALRDPIGRALAMGLLLLMIAACGLVGASWLLMTKV